VNDINEKILINAINIIDQIAINLIIVLSESVIIFNIHIIQVSSELNDANGGIQAIFIQAKRVMIHKKGIIFISHHIFEIFLVQVLSIILHAIINISDFVNE